MTSKQRSEGRMRVTEPLPPCDLLLLPRLVPISSPSFSRQARDERSNILEENAQGDMRIKTGGQREQCAEESAVEASQRHLRTKVS